MMWGATNDGMRLPDKFESSMRALLGEEADAFFATYAMPRTTGLRLNGLKLSRAEYEARFGAAGLPIPWADGGLYTDEDDRPGKHLHYYLGLYYIQEPSAMLPAELLDVRSGHRVLDLCAAPGGKSTQLASKLQGRGLLVANDNAAERTKALAKNVERAGATGIVVTNEEPARLADAFGAFFDRVLVDAPCSGEGMFRKDEDMIREWERHSVERCSAMQRDILREAARLVAPGGKLLYSTCTFSPSENEGSIARFLAEHPEFDVERIEAPAEWGLGPGRPDWLNGDETAGLAGERLASLAGAARIWPHRSRGEGHFAALLARRGGAGGAPGPQASGLAAAPGPQTAGRAAAAVTPPATVMGLAEGDGPDDEPWSFPALAEPEAGAAMASSVAGGKRGARPESSPRGRRGAADSGVGARGKNAASPEADMRDKLLAFVRDHLPDWKPRGKLYVRGEQLYLQPEELPALGRLRLVRPGWLLGSATKHRFEPSQALAMGLKMTDAARTLRLSAGEAEALRYMKGETLQPDPGRIVGRDGSPESGRGWTLVCIDGFPAGWGRWDGSLLKNELLPGWRWL